MDVFGGVEDDDGDNEGGVGFDGAYGDVSAGEKPSESTKQLFWSVA